MIYVLLHRIEVPQNVRVAALMSIGFLYQGSAHRYMTEVLLAEIDRPPGPEMDNCVDRESYSVIKRQGSFL